MSDDDLVARLREFVLWIAPQRPHELVVEEAAARILAAIRALPDELPADNDIPCATYSPEEVWYEAMRQVKALLDGES
jgi:hypothetical protein